MLNEKFYCPPTGNLPQPLYDYCRFENGVVRTDLQTIDDDELHAWGWDGPYTFPTSKRVIQNTEELSAEMIESLMNDESLEYNEETQEWSSIVYDYDFETHKSVWYSKERRFIILPKDEDSSEYEIPYKSNVVPPGQFTSQVEQFIPAIVPEPAPEPSFQLPPVLWNEFKTYLISSVEFNQYVSSLMSTFPIIATSFPLAILQLEMSRYSYFTILWNTLKENNALPSTELIENLISIANQYNLPQDFIHILLGE